MSGKRSDAATEAHWGFLEDAELVRALQRQSRQLAARWGLETDDVLQEVYLWLSVRPELHGSPHPLILYRAGSAIGSTMGRRQGRIRHYEVPLEEGFGE